MKRRRSATPVGVIIAVMEDVCRRALLQREASVTLTSTGIVFVSRDKACFAEDLRGCCERNCDLAMFHELTQLWKNE